MRKLFPAIVIMGVDDYNSELQVSVPGSFLIQLEPSEPFMFYVLVLLIQLSLTCIKNKQNPMSFKKKSVFKLCFCV